MNLRTQTRLFELFRKIKQFCFYHPNLKFKDKESAFDITAKILYCAINNQCPLNTFEITCSDWELLDNEDDEYELDDKEIHCENCTHFDGDQMRCVDDKMRMHNWNVFVIQILKKLYDDPDLIDAVKEALKYTM